MDTVEKFAYYAHRDEAIEGEIPTPKHICTDMVNMSNNSIYDRIDAKYLDIYCKSGRFLKAIYEKLIASTSLKEHYGNDTDKLKEEILKHYLYGIVPNEAIAAIVRKELYGDPNHIGNILVIEDYKAKMKSNNFGRNSNGSVKTFREEINERFGQGMKFDEVIGNPPYNSDAYIDFVRGGYNLIKDDGCVIMITPAKWQAKGGKKNEDFRKDIVPHMSKIVYYPDCKMVFNIGEIDGVSYYIVDKANKYRVKHIVNRCHVNDKLNSEVERELDTLWNCGSNIVQKTKHIQRFKFKYKNERLQYQYWCNTQVSLGGQCGSGKTCLLTQDGKCKVIGAGYLLKREEKCQSGTADIIFSANNITECKYFISWINTKFVRFMILINVCTLTGTLNSNNWKFVPDPGPFDHIFTDAELYKKYNLTEEEINIIESVIKERKND